MTGGEAFTVSPPMAKPTKRPKPEKLRTTAKKSKKEQNTMINIFQDYEHEKKALNDAGVENIKSYCLINNDGYTFTKNGTPYDFRHWLNCYGASVDFYTLTDTANNTSKSFDDFDNAIDYIKSL